MPIRARRRRSPSYCVCSTFSLTARPLSTFSRLCSTEADPPPVDPIAGVGTVSKPRIVLDGLVRFVCKPWH